MADDVQKANYDVILRFEGVLGDPTTGGPKAEMDRLATMIVSKFRGSPTFQVSLVDIKELEEA